MYHPLFSFGVERISPGYLKYPDAGDKCDSVCELYTVVPNFRSSSRNSLLFFLSFFLSFLPSRERSAPRVTFLLLLRGSRVITHDFTLPPFWYSRILVLRCKSSLARSVRREVRVGDACLRDCARACSRSDENLN